jgi:hypothetical protein
MHETNGFIGKEIDNPRVTAQSKVKIAVESYKNIFPAYNEARKDGFSSRTTISRKSEGTLNHPAVYIKN